MFNWHALNKEHGITFTHERPLWPFLWDRTPDIPKMAGSHDDLRLIFEVSMWAGRLSK